MTQYNRAPEIVSQAVQMSCGDSSDFHHSWALNSLIDLGANKTDLIVDLGAGKGYLLNILAKAGFSNLVGVDAFPAPGEAQFRWVSEDLNKMEATQLAHQAQWVICTEVIEHLENPRHLFRIIRKIMKPGAHLLLTTPNVETIRSILSFVLRGHFIDFLDSSYPAHITALNRMDLERLFRESQIQIERIEYSNRGVLPKLNHLTWQFVSAGLARGKRFSDHILFIGRA